MAPRQPFAAINPGTGESRFQKGRVRFCSVGKTHRVPRREIGGIHPPDNRLTWRLGQTLAGSSLGWTTSLERTSTISPVRTLHEEPRMQHHHRRGIGRRLPGLSVFALLASLMAPSPARSQTTPSSYDQIAPVLLGKETFQAVMAKDKADKDVGHGPPEEAPGGALRPDTAARRQADHVPRQADPGRPDREAAGRE